MLNVPEAHHEGDQDCTIQDLIKHHCMTQHLPDYECIVCKVRGLANKVTVITECPSILCIVLCRKKMNNESIKSFVQFPISGFKIAEDDLRYNLLGTVHHFPRTTDNGHYTSICQSQQSKSRTWFNYDDDQIKNSHFTNKRMNNQVLKKYTKLVNILFYVSRALQTNIGRQSPKIHIRESSDSSSKDDQDETRRGRGETNWHYISLNSKRWRKWQKRWHRERGGGRWSRIIFSSSEGASNNRISQNFLQWEEGHFFCICQEIHHLTSTDLANWGSMHTRLLLYKT